MSEPSSRALPFEIVGGKRVSPESAAILRDFAATLDCPYCTSDNEAIRTHLLRPKLRWLRCQNGGRQMKLIGPYKVGEPENEDESSTVLNRNDESLTADEIVALLNLSDTAHPARCEGAFSGAKMCKYCGGDLEPMSQPFHCRAGIAQPCSFPNCNCGEAQGTPGVTPPASLTEQMVEAGEMRYLEMSHPEARDFVSSPWSKNLVTQIYYAMRRAKG